MRDLLFAIGIVTILIGCFIFTGGITLLMTHGGCKHQNTRCLHGDEIMLRAKAFAFRWWKGMLIYRQVCIDCGKALDRNPICAYTQPQVHIWSGDWPTKWS